MKAGKKMLRKGHGSSKPARKGTSTKADYTARAEQALKGIQISKKVVSASEAFSSNQKKLILEGLETIRQQIVAAEPAFRNVKSLAYIEQAIVQPWNEMPGKDAEEFWRRSAEAGLDYARRDVVRDVLSRGRIASELEYEVVVDTFEMLEQSGKITAAEAASLSNLVAKFGRSR